jgi:four helix bundle protein
MNFDEWEQNIPAEIRSDPLWELKIYRQAMFLCEIGWHDATKLIQDPRTVQLSDMLYRSLGSISAYIAEGYSRGSVRNMLQYYEHALGAARASRDWYYKGRHVLGERVTDHRIKTLAEFIESLQKKIESYRVRSLSETRAEYGERNRAEGTQLAELESMDLHGLSVDIPLPQV